MSLFSLTKLFVIWIDAIFTHKDDNVICVKLCLAEKVTYRLRLQIKMKGNILFSIFDIEHFLNFVFDKEDNFPQVLTRLKKNIRAV